MRYASRAARRYARALAAMAPAIERQQALLEQLRAFDAKLEAVPDLRVFLEHRRIAGSRKVAVLEGIDADAGEGDRLLPTDELAHSFCDLVIRNGRVGLFGQILTALEDLLDAERGLVRARVTTAVPLLKLEREQIAAKIRALSGAREVDLDCQVSKRILGGVVIHFSERVIDASVRTYLDTMRETLRRVRVSEFDHDGFLPLDTERLKQQAAGGD